MLKLNGIVGNVSAKFWRGISAVLIFIICFNQPIMSPTVFLRTVTQTVFQNVAPTLPTTSTSLDFVTLHAASLIQNVHNFSHVYPIMPNTT